MHKQESLPRGNVFPCLVFAMFCFSQAGGNGNSSAPHHNNVLAAKRQFNACVLSASDQHIMHAYFAAVLLPPSTPTHFRTSGGTRWCRLSLVGLFVISWALTWSPCTNLCHHKVGQVVLGCREGCCSSWLRAEVHSEARRQQCAVQLVLCAVSKPKACWLVCSSYGIL